jgi:hypothetical protein
MIAAWTRSRASTLASIAASVRALMHPNTTDPRPQFPLPPGASRRARDGFAQASQGRRASDVPGGSAGTRMHGRRPGGGTAACPERARVTHRRGRSAWSRSICRPLWALCPEQERPVFLDCPWTSCVRMGVVLAPRRAGCRCGTTCERAVRPRADSCLTLAEQSSEVAGLAQPVVVRCMREPRLAVAIASSR